MEVVDLDGDGVPEIIVAIGDGDNELYRRDDPTTPGDGTTLPDLTKTDLPHPSGTPQLTGSTSVTTIDVDEDGDLDVLFTNDDGTMTTWINDGSGGLTPDTKNTLDGGSDTRKNTDSSGIMKVADQQGQHPRRALRHRHHLQPRRPANPNTGTGTGYLGDGEPNPVHARQGPDASGGAGH